MNKSKLLPFALPFAALMLSAAAHAGPDHTEAAAGPRRDDKRHQLARCVARCRCVCMTRRGAA